MKIAFELPFSRRPATLDRKACSAVQLSLCRYFVFGVAASGESACHSDEGVF
ncbi:MULTISPECIES: hypothetical protein [Rhizobium]|uniref:hypothetical protein n=1 Tax=Rhizobium TaxID=379 RepID=UPI00143A52B7|nr:MULTISPECIES: hypothetical protein [Rhizobium]MDE8759553.1 hypothetical protein [Rhizobium sp. CBK13]